MKTLLPTMFALLMVVGLALGTSQAAQHKANDADFKGKHMMSGEVTEIDHQRGTMTVETGIAPLELHFPPPAIADIQEGDQVTVQLAIKPAKKGDNKQ
jgi:hypothetical protein